MRRINRKNIAFVFPGVMDTWSEKHDIALCREVLVLDPFQFPYRSRERGDVWNEIANNLNAMTEIRFKINKRSVRDRLTLIQGKYKAKMRQEEAASGVECEETELDQALGEISEKEKMAEELKELSSDKKKAEKAAAEEHRQQACERLGETKKRSGSNETDASASTKSKKSRRSTSDTVEYLKEKTKQESEWKKQELELRAKEQEANRDLQKQQMEMMKALIQQQQQQSQMLMAMLAQKKQN